MLQPRHWMRTINFRTEAVRAATQPNSTHDNTAKSFSLIRSRDTGGVGTKWLSPVYNCFGMTYEVTPTEGRIPVRCP
jgi:hypothetical protein